MRAGRPATPAALRVNRPACDQMFGRIQERLARRRQDDRAAAALHQRRAGPGLQRADAPAESRVGDMAQFRRTGEAARLGQEQKVFKPLRFHGQNLWFSFAPLPAAWRAWPGPRATRPGPERRQAHRRVTNQRDRPCRPRAARRVSSLRARRRGRAIQAPMRCAPACARLISRHPSARSSHIRPSASTCRPTEEQLMAVVLEGPSGGYQARRT